MINTINTKNPASGTFVCTSPDRYRVLIESRGISCKGYLAPILNTFLQSSCYEMVARRVLHCSRLSSLTPESISYIIQHRTTDLGPSGWSMRSLRCRVIDYGISSLRMVAPIDALFLPCLINRRALGNTVVVALPHNIGVGWKGQQAFDGFAVPVSWS